MPKYEKKKYKKAILFLIVSSAFLVLYGFIGGYISVVYDDSYTLFGLPFALDYVLFGLVMLIIAIILFLFFPRVKEAQEV